MFSLLKLYILLKYSEKRYEIQLASETGTFGWDDHSVVPDFLNGEIKEIFDNANSEFNVALKNLKKASDLDPNDYDIFSVVLVMVLYLIIHMLKIYKNCYYCL